MSYPYNQSAPIPTALTVNDRLSALLDLADAIGNRVSSLSARIHGPHPEAGPTQREAVSGVIDGTNRLETSLRAVLERLSEVVDII